MSRHECIDTISMPVVHSGPSNSWKSWLLAGIVLLLSEVTRILETLKLWQQRINMRSNLQKMDDRLLLDTGITGADALREIRKPFWRG